MASRDIPAAIAGLAGVGLNLAAVAALGPVPHTYKPGDVPAWLAESLAAPVHTTVSGWAFTVGLALFVPFCAGLARRDPGLTTGAAMFAVGAALNAAGTFGPVAALHAPQAAGEALLWMALLLDSHFNLMLGLGLLAMAAGMAPGAWPKGLRWLAVAAGLASLPVALQFQADAFARLLIVSGPLWAAWVVWASVRLMRAPAA